MVVKLETFRKARTSLISVTVMLVAAACGTGGDGGSDGDLPVVRLMVLSTGMSAVGLKAMEVSGSDKANGFEGEFNYVDPDSENQFFIQGQADVDVGLDPVAVAIFRNQGFDVSTYYHYQPNYACLVAKSEYSSPEELIGKKVGNTGADSGTTQSLAVTLNKFWDLSLTDDYVPVQAAPQALVELLKSGEIEAAGLYEPYTSRAVVDGGAKCLTGHVGDVWQKETGGTVSYTSFVAFNEWIDENPELALSATQAMADAVKWLKEDPSRIQQDEFSEFIGTDDTKILERIESEIKDDALFDVRWDQRIIDANTQMLNALAEDGTILEKVPDGIFRDLSKEAGKDRGGS